MKPAAQRVTIALDEGQAVSGLLQVPCEPRACYVLAHGAGAGMGHPFMASIAEGLTERGVATLRYQFPYMERGSKRPDAPKLAHAAVRAAVAEMSRLAPDLALIAGGKSSDRPFERQRGSQRPAQPGTPRGNQSPAIAKLSLGRDDVAPPPSRTRR